MLLLGIGGTTPTTVQVPGLNLDISTTGPALTVMVLGFGVAVAVYALAIAYAKGRKAGRDQMVIALARARPDPSAKEILELATRTRSECMLLDARVPRSGLWRELLIYRGGALSPLAAERWKAIADLATSAEQRTGPDKGNEQESSSRSHMQEK